VKFHGKSYPLIPITLGKGRRRVNTFALLDSGASISVFRPEIAKALRIPFINKDAVRLGTASGGVDIGIAKVDIQVEQTKFKTKIGFSEHQAASFNILGREGFFHKFSVCFNEMMKTVIMVPLGGLKS
jgi:Aspartyl protease